jgi:hypothetical protein
MTWNRCEAMLCEEIWSQAPPENRKLSGDRRTEVHLLSSHLLRKLEFMARIVIPLLTHWLKGSTVNGSTSTPAYEPLGINTYMSVKRGISIPRISSN